MKKIDLGQSIQILANVGVLAGIVFLGVELRQNNQLLSTQAQMQLDENRRGESEAIYGDESLARILVKAEHGEDLDPVETLRLERFYRTSFLRWESDYRQLRAGFLEDLRADAINGALYSNPRMLEMWEKSKVGFPPDFVQWMEENVVNER